jgi:hypothetical protein
VRLDHEAQTEILRNCDREQRIYLLPYLTACQKYTAIQSYYGGGTLMDQARIKTEYGAITLKSCGGDVKRYMSLMFETREMYHSQGGSISEPDFLQDIISRTLDKRHPSKYSYQRDRLMDLLMAHTLTYVQVRNTLLTAEQQLRAAHEESSDDDDGEEVPAIDKALVTRSSRSSLEARLGRMEAMITKLAEGREGRGGRGGGGHRGDKKECWSFRDTGACKFGDKCRFLHGKPE